MRICDLQITQGKFIHPVFLLHRHDGAICLIQEGDVQNLDPSAPPEPARADILLP